MYFLVNTSSKPLDMALQSSQVHMSHDLDGTGQHLCDIDPKVKVI